MSCSPPRTWLAAVTESPAATPTGALVVTARLHFGGSWEYSEEGCVRMPARHTRMRHAHSCTIVRYVEAFHSPLARRRHADPRCTVIAPHRTASLLASPSHWTLINSGCHSPIVQVGGVVTGGDYPTDPLGEVCHVVHRVACDGRQGLMIHTALRLHPLGDCWPSASGALRETQHAQGRFDTRTRARIHAHTCRMSGASRSACLHARSRMRRRTTRTHRRIWLFPLQE